MKPFVREWRRQVFQSELASSTKLVLVALSDHMDPDGGRCFPSVRLLARDCSLHTETVSHHLQLAGEAGWYERKRRGRKGQSWNYEYEPLIPESVRTSRTLSKGKRTDQPDTLAESVRIESSKAYGSAVQRETIEERTPPLTPPHPESARTDQGAGESPPPERTSPPEQPPLTLSRLPRRNGRRVYPDPFEDAWAAYPKRAGGNSKPDAYSAWRAQRVAGVPAEQLAAGVRRYAPYCEAEGMVGTRYVKQASTFFGRGEHWREDWSLAPSQNGRGPPRAERYTSGRKVLAAMEADEE